MERTPERTPGQMLQDNLERELGRKQNLACPRCPKPVSVGPFKTETAVKKIVERGLRAISVAIGTDPQCGNSFFVNVMVTGGSIVLHLSQEKIEEPTEEAAPPPAEVIERHGTLAPGVVPLPPSSPHRQRTQIIAGVGPVDLPHGQAEDVEDLDPVKDHEHVTDVTCDPVEKRRLDLGTSPTAAFYAVDLSAIPEASAVPASSSPAAATPPARLVSPPKMPAVPQPDAPRRRTPLASPPPAPSSVAPAEPIAGIDFIMPRIQPALPQRLTELPDPNRRAAWPSPPATSTSSASAEQPPADEPPGPSDLHTAETAITPTAKPHSPRGTHGIIDTGEAATKRIPMITYAIRTVATELAERVPSGLLAARTFVKRHPGGIAGVSAAVAAAVAALFIVTAKNNGKTFLPQAPVPAASAPKSTDAASPPERIAESRTVNCTFPPPNFKPDCIPNWPGQQIKFTPGSVTADGNVKGQIVEIITASVNGATAKTCRFVVPPFKKEIGRPNRTPYECTY